MGSADTFTVPGSPLVTDWQSTLRYQSPADRWLNVEIQGVLSDPDDLRSTLEKPLLEAKLLYTQNGRAGFQVRVTVPGAVRVPVYGSAVDVHIANPNSAPWPVLVSVSEGVSGGGGDLFHSYSVLSLDGTPQNLRKVPFAEYLKVTVSDRSKLSDVLIEGFNFLGSLVMAITVDQIPAGGLPMAGLASARISTISGGSVDCQITQTLSF